MAQSPDLQPHKSTHSYPTNTSTVDPHAQSQAAPLAWLATFALFTVVGGWLRLSYLQLTEFGIDQQAAMQVAKAIRMGWDYPMAGMRLGVGALAGFVEPYLLTLPQLLNQDPETSAVFVALLGMGAAALFAWTVNRWLGVSVALLTYSFCMTLPWLVYYNRKIWTPDYFPLFSAIVVALLALALADGRRWALPAATFTLGLQLQIHWAALMLLPAVFLLVVIFSRRLTATTFIASLASFLASLTPFFIHSLRTNWEDLRYLTSSSTGAASFDLRSLEVFTSLVAGANFPEALGIQLAPQAPGIDWPFFPALVMAALWLGVGLATWDCMRAWRSDQWSRQHTVLLILLVWVMVPLVLNFRHSVPVYFRYLLYLLPIGVFFPAYALQRLLRYGTGLLASKAAGLRTSILAPAATMVVAVLFGLWGGAEAEIYHRSLLTAPPQFGSAVMDVYSGPAVKDTREALLRLSQFVSPERESVIVGNVQRGPLEYLADSRYRLRFSDDPRVLILPSEPATLAILPEAAPLAELAVEFGAQEQTSASLLWPPEDKRARVFATTPDTSHLGSGFMAISERQKLANGLSLSGYRIANVVADGFDLTTVWQVVEQKWTSKHWLYNSFVNISKLNGEPVSAAGEVELSTSSNWKQDDLLIVPVRVKTEQPLERGLYRLDHGVYVRFPPRAPISPETDSVDHITSGPAILGVMRSATGSETRLAEFASGIVLVAVEQQLAPDGRGLHVSTTWRSSGPTATGLTMFVHLYDHADRLVAQADAPPRNGAYPTNHWGENELIIDQRDLELKQPLAAGRYQLRAGFYDPTSQQRLATVPASPDSAVSLASIDVQ